MTCSTCYGATKTSRAMLAAIALLALLVYGCGSSGGAHPAATPGAGAGSGSSAGSGGAGGSTPALEAGAAGKLDTVLMPLLSKTAPVFGSDGPQTDNGPQNAVDGDPGTTWRPVAVPAWIAVDVSAAPADQRKQVAVVWNCPKASGYIASSVDTPTALRPVDYTIEVNAAAGGGDPPTTGWNAVATVTGGRYFGRQHVVDLSGGNWVRMSITKASDPAPYFAIDLDVYGAPNGDSDGWLFMGDSITYISTYYVISDIPTLVKGIKSDRYPAIIDAAIGGTSTGTAVNVIQDTMKDFPGRFVTLNYGTNDVADMYMMETLVQDVIAAGKVPVVPHMPWSATNIDKATNINKQIDALYLKYPQILPGPDLYATFLNHPEWIPATDVHPNSDGQEQLRKAWAKVIAAVP